MADRDRLPRRVRRSWADGEKRAVVARTHAPGVTVSAAARRHGLNANQLFNRTEDRRFGGERVPMHRVDVAKDEPVKSESAEHRIEVEAPNGVRLRRGSDVDAEALAQIASISRRAS